MSNQLIKNTALGTEKVFPKTYTEGIVDKSTGKKLAEILSNYNMYFLSYTGNTAQTRCQVPKDLRREGLWITYVDFNHKVVTEWYNSDNIEDDTFGSDTYWRQGSNKLVGDISISSNGNWVINGNETEFKATGDPIKPLLRVNLSTNKLQVSYDDGNKYENLGDNLVYTTFRTANNKLLVSTDLGKTWTDTSEPIAAWFRWGSGDTVDSVGKILISRDNSVWEDLSPNIVNNLRIKGYVSTVGNLPSSASLGDIYMVGPTYDTSDTTHDYPHYRMWVKLSSGWVDNGEYLSNVLISLTTGLETGITMSQKAITDKFNTPININQLDDLVKSVIDNCLIVDKGTVVLSEENVIDLNDVSLLGTSFAIREGTLEYLKNYPPKLTNAFCTITTYGAYNKKSFLGGELLIIKCEAENYLWLRLRWSTYWQSWKIIDFRNEERETKIKNMMFHTLLPIEPSEDNIIDLNLLDAGTNIVLRGGDIQYLLNKPNDMKNAKAYILTSKYYNVDTIVGGVYLIIIEHINNNDINIWYRNAWKKEITFSLWKKIYGSNFVNTLHIVDSSITLNKLDINVRNSITQIDTNLPITLIDSILFIGDSVTHGANVIKRNGENVNLGANYALSYPIMLLKKYNWLKINNKAISGHNILLAESIILPKCDCTENLCVIELGWNLRGGEGLYNTFYDTYDTDVAPYSDYNDYADTNMGIYCKMIEEIKEKNPNIIICLVCSQGWGADNANRTKAVHRIATEYNLLIIDFNDENLYPINYRLNSDGVHATLWGYTLKAEYFAKGLGIAFRDHNYDVMELIYKLKGMLS